MSYGFGMFGVVGFLIPIAAIVAGIVALKFSKSAGWLMISAPIFLIASYLFLFVVQDLFTVSGSIPTYYFIFSLFPIFAQALFLAGVFMILLQAKSIKKRAEEQQMLLDEITSRQ
jgi:hypothetical protein